MKVDEAVDRTGGDPVFVSNLLRRAPGSNAAPDIPRSCVVGLQKGGDFRLPVERDWAGTWVYRHVKSLPRFPHPWARGQWRRIARLDYAAPECTDAPQFRSSADRRTSGDALSPLHSPAAGASDDQSSRQRGGPGTCITP